MIYFIIELQIIYYKTMFIFWESKLNYRNENLNKAEDII